MVCPGCSLDVSAGFPGASKRCMSAEAYAYENGTIYTDMGDEFIKFRSLEELNAFSLFANAKFIEFVE